MSDPTIAVVEFHSLTGQPLTEHGVHPALLEELREMFEDVRVVRTDCACEFCEDERARRGVHTYEEPPEPVRCGLCQSRKPLAPGRTICENCAYWPLD